MELNTFKQQKGNYWNLRVLLNQKSNWWNYEYFQFAIPKINIFQIRYLFWYETFSCFKIFINIMRLYFDSNRLKYP